MAIDPKLRKINLGVFIRELEVYAEDAGNANRSVSLPPNTVLAIARHLYAAHEIIRELVVLIGHAPGMKMSELMERAKLLDEQTQRFHEIEVV